VEKPQKGRKSTLPGMGATVPPKKKSSRPAGKNSRGPKSKSSGLPRKSKRVDTKDGLGPVSAVPLLKLDSIVRVVKTAREIMSLPLDSRSAYVLSLIEGPMSVETIIDLSSVREREVFVILEQLLTLGVIEPKKDQKR
jgi:hypothetical protein